MFLSRAAWTVICVAGLIGGAADAAPAADAQAGDPSKVQVAPLPPEIVRLEADGKFGDALQALQGDAFAAHRQKLELVSAAACEAGTPGGRAALNALQPKLTAPEDVGLVAGVARTLSRADVAAGKRSLEDSEWLNCKAETLAARKKYAEALAVYKLVTDGQDKTVLPARLREAVAAGQARALAAQQKDADAASSASLRRSIRAGLRTLGVWAVCLLAVGVPVALLIKSKRYWPPRKATLIDVEDLTATSGSDADRAATNRRLTQEVSAALAALSQPTTSTAIDGMPDLDGSAFPEFVAQRPFDLAKLPLSDTAVSVGPFSLNPRQLLALAGQLLSPPYQFTMSGALTPQAGGSVLTAQRSDHCGRRVAANYWQCSATHPDAAAARRAVVEELALRVAFELLTGPRPTDNWLSFHAYHAANQSAGAACAGAEYVNSLERARGLYQEAVRHDPGNWAAWYGLATTLRRLGYNDLAAEHFEFIFDLLLTFPQAPGLEEFRSNHPSFPLVVAYNWAVCLSKWNRPEAHADAMALLDQLIAVTQNTVPGEVDPLHSLHNPPAAQRAVDRLAPFAQAVTVPDEKLRLNMLFRSARASTRGFVLEYRLSDDSDKPGHAERLLERKRAALERIDEDCRAIQDEGEHRLRTRTMDLRANGAAGAGAAGDDAAREIWRALVVARAVAENARGRALYRMDRYADAVGALKTAVTLMPDLVDPYVNLAQVCLKAKGRVDSNWGAQAETYLLQALALSPANQKAHYLLGRLYAEPVFARFEKAKEQLRLAPLFAYSYYYLSGLLARDGDLRGAIDALRQSIALAGAADHRHAEYAQLVLQYTAALPAEGSGVKPPSGAEIDRLLETAGSVLRALAKSNRRSDQKRAEELLERIGQRQRELRPTPEPVAQGGKDAASPKGGTGEGGAAPPGAAPDGDPTSHTPPPAGPPNA